MNSNREIFLVVSQDVFIIQTYSGFLGQIIKKFYLLVFNWRLRFLLFFLSKNSDIILLTSDIVNFAKEQDIKVFKYSEELAKINVSKYRKDSLKTVKEILEKLLAVGKKNLKFEGVNTFDLWWSQTAVQLSYYYFPYLEVIEKLMSEYKPKSLWVLGKSKEERMAVYLAKKRNIKIKKFSFLDLSWLNNFLQKFLFSRQLKNKQKAFLSKSKQNCLKSNYDYYKNSYLLSADFFRHLKTLVPLYKKFKEKGKKVFFVSDIANIDSLLPNLYKIDKDYFFLAETISPELIFSKLQLYREIFREVWRSFLRLEKRSASINVQDFWEVIKVMEHFFEPLIKEGLPLAKIYLQAANQLIKKTRPKGVICLNDIRLMENAFLLMAKQYQVKTLIAYTGMFLSTEKSSRFDANYFSAIGEYIKDELVRIDYPRKKIVVNGDPQLDFLANKRIFSKKKIYEKLSIDPKKKIILLISDRPNPMLSYEEKKEQFEKVAKVAEKFSNVKLVVKPHPTEKRENLLTDLQTWQIQNALVSNNSQIELFELLSVASVVIIAWSMVGFEAMLFKVPVIVANFTDKDYDLQIPYVKGEGVVKAETSEELKDYIKVFIDKKSILRKEQIKNGWRFCSKYYRLPLGGAAERIVELIA